MHCYGIHLRQTTNYVCCGTKLDKQPKWRPTCACVPLCNCIDRFVWIANNRHPRTEPCGSSNIKNTLRLENFKYKTDSLNRLFHKPNSISSRDKQCINCVIDSRTVAVALLYTRLFVIRLLVHLSLPIMSLFDFFQGNIIFITVVVTVVVDVVVVVVL